MVAASHKDDFRGLSGLLFGAKERYHSVRATVRHFRRGGLATEAINRYVEYGFRHSILSNFDPPYDVPTYRESRVGVGGVLALETSGPPRGSL